MISTGRLVPFLLLSSLLKPRFFVRATECEAKVDLIALDKGVTKEIKQVGEGAILKKGETYASEVTLYLEAADGTLTPAGWSTRGSSPFNFSPGKNLIEGWSIGALSMRVGERAMVHVPYQVGYGDSPQGSKGGGWYIPARSNLCFDLQV